MSHDAARLATAAINPRQRETSSRSDGNDDGDDDDDDSGTVEDPSLAACDDDAVLSEEDSLCVLSAHTTPPPVPTDGESAPAKRVRRTYAPKALTHHSVPNLGGSGSASPAMSASTAALVAASKRLSRRAATASSPAATAVDDEAECVRQFALAVPAEFKCLARDYDMYRAVRASRAAATLDFCTVPACDGRSPTGDACVGCACIVNAQCVRSALRPHQVEAVRWMRTVEELHARWPTEYNGAGVLADSMGLGKTLSVLALCASHRPSAGEARATAVAFAAHRALGDGGGGGGGGGAAGAQRRWRVHPQSVRCTLVVCPKSLIDEWQREVAKHTRGMRAFVMHGVDIGARLGAMSTAEFVHTLDSHDIALTTYGTLGTRACRDMLARVHFCRVVLDEAHSVRNRAGATHRSVDALSATYRWCATGSPINNHLGDMYSLVRWLRYAPYDRPAVWDRFVMSGVPTPTAVRAAAAVRSDGDGDGSDDDVMPTRGSAVRRNMCEQLMLRRTKSTLELPVCTNNYVFVDLDGDERRVYDYIWERTREQVGDIDALLGGVAGAGGGGGGSYFRALERLLRVRQCCDHVGLVDARCVPAQWWQTHDVADTTSMLAAKFDTKRRGANHREDADGGGATAAPMSMLERDMYGTDSDGGSDDAATAAPELPSTAGVYKSAKLRTLLTLVRMTLNDDDGGHLKKCVVFSNWTSMLDIVERALHESYPVGRSGVDILRLDGTQSRRERSRVQQTFTAQPRARVLLASTKACSLGLNLQVAEAVFIVEPWWNPQVERQAIDRVHRLGQRHAVSVYRLVAKDTVEERIVRIQRGKERLADGVLDAAGDAAAATSAASATAAAGGKCQQTS